MKNKNKFLVLILIFLVSFLFFSNQKEKEEEILNYYNYVSPNGESFQFNLTQVGENERHILEYNFIRDGIKRLSIIPFRYSPNDLEEIYMEDVRLIILNTEVVYISRDYYLEEMTNSKDAIAILTLSRVIDIEMDPDIFQIPTGIGITYPVEGVFSPVINCDHSSLEARVVELRVGDETKIYQEGEYCVVMQFKEGTDPIEVATKLTYHVLDIM